MPVAEGASDTDPGDTVKKALAPLSSEQAAVGGLCPASGRELLGPSPGRVREEPSVCLGAVGSAETADMLCGLSRDSPAEAGTWSTQAPHQLQRGAWMGGIRLSLWQSGGKEDMGSLTRQVLSEGCVSALELSCHWKAASQDCRWV